MPLDQKAAFIKKIKNGSPARRSIAAGGFCALQGRVFIRFSCGFCRRGRYAAKARTAVKYKFFQARE